MDNQVLTKREIARALVTEVPTPSQLRRNPGASLLADFNPLQLARAIETEVFKAQQAGLSKLRLTIDLPEATDLAKFLRRGVKKGT